MGQTHQQQYAFLGGIALCASVSSKGAEIRFNAPAQKNRFAGSR